MQCDKNITIYNTVCVKLRFTSKTQQYTVSDVVDGGKISAELSINGNGGPQV